MKFTKRYNLCKNYLSGSGLSSIIFLAIKELVINNNTEIANKVVPISSLETIILESNFIFKINIPDQTSTGHFLKRLVQREKIDLLAGM